METDFWIGLENPTHATCYDKESCHSRLNWADGEVFNMARYMVHGVANDIGSPCLAVLMGQNKTAQGIPCEDMIPSLCQLHCNAAANALAGTRNDGELAR